MPDSDEQERQFTRLVATITLWLEDNKDLLIGRDKGTITLDFNRTHIEGDICIKRLRGRALPMVLADAA